MRKKEISESEIKQCLSVLQSLIDDSSLLTNIADKQRIDLLKAAGKLSRPDREEIRKRNKDVRNSRREIIVNREKKKRAATGIRSAREANVFSAPKQIKSGKTVQKNQFLKSPRNCYICKTKFIQLHFFYDALCPDCAEFNYQKRFQSAPLKGQVALITGARLKIGYQSALKMLRAGATVIATTRFPVDAALRCSEEEDFKKWGNRLQIYGLDLRHTPSVEIFSRFIEQNYNRLDILINNAAQTVRRPPGFYAHLMENETNNQNEMPGKILPLMSNYYNCLKQLDSFTVGNGSNVAGLPVTWDGKTPGIGLRASAKLSQIPYAYDHTLNTDEVFPKGQVDSDLQQVDLREVNSWRLKMGEIPTAEMIELQLVNAIAPFVLINRLVPLMKRENTGQKHIVNVSAMEGKFLRFKKDSRHPHTNMAKAALNMLTHTSAEDLAKYGIFTNAVDTGWVTDEDPVALAEFKKDKHDFQPPLDIVDGAARVCDPFFDGILTGKHWCGKFLKDYFPIDW